MKNRQIRVSRISRPKQHRLHTLTAADVHVPANVPPSARKTYIENYLNVTKRTGRVMLFAGDQKIEHLNDDFYGTDIPEENNDPEHLFRIAAGGTIGVFATQHGMISRYGPDYPDVSYVVKMNSRTNATTGKLDPNSKALCSIEDVLDLKRNGKLKIVGIGYTLYVGSQHEPEMLAEAGQLIAHAHEHGLLSIIWAYPRGQSIPDPKDSHLIAGASGVACSLGADFVKVNLPTQGVKSLREAVGAAGRTGVVVSGGSMLNPKDFLKMVYQTLHLSGVVGSATGRNIHEHPLADAIRMTDAVSSIIYGNKTVDEAYQVFIGKDSYKLL